MPKPIWILGAFFILFSAQGQQQKITIINDVTLFKDIVKDKDIQLIDVRTPQEYAQGFISNALNLDFYNQQEFIEGVRGLDKKKPVYLYCHSGVRSKKASTILSNLGFEEIYDFKPGYRGWSQSQAN